MDAQKVKLFMQLGGQEVKSKLSEGSELTRKLGAQLLLSELLEYIIKGLGVTPVINGVAVTDPENVTYNVTQAPDKIEMIDGLSDVAYTMYWNANAFGIPLEEAYDLVCDNNLEKFVKIEDSGFSPGILSKDRWHCGEQIEWPKDVVSVEIVDVDNQLFAVGKDARNKIRKPSSYKSVDLSCFV